MERIAIIGEYNPFREFIIRSHYENNGKKEVADNLIFMDYNTEEELYKMIKTAFRMEVDRIILSTSRGELAQLVRQDGKRGV